MAEVAGIIRYDIDADTSKFDRKLSGAASKAKATASTTDGLFKGLASSVGNYAGNVGSAMRGVVDAGAEVASQFKWVGVAVVGGLGLAAKASLDMVRSVQKSTIALTTYTGSAQAASKISKELVDFATSPQGVLFNRDELLQAATLLKGAGAETQKLTGYIKAMAPAVAVSGRGFGEIAQILSKVVATGKLSAIEFDQLADRGIVLDRSMRGATVSADELFAALSKRIPPDQLEKYAQTVEGRMIRLKTAFRNLGNSLLGVQYGVDGLGASFAPGSLGDRFMKGMEQVTETLKSPEAKQAMADLGKTVGNFVEKALPKLLDGMLFLARNMDKVIAVTSVLIGLWATKKAVDFGESIAKLGVKIFELTAALGGANTSMALLQKTARAGIVVGILIDIALIYEAIKAFQQWQKEIKATDDSLSAHQDQIDALTKKYNAMPAGPKKEETARMIKEAQQRQDATKAEADSWEGWSGFIRGLGDVFDNIGKGFSDFMFKLSSNQGIFGGFVRTLLSVTTVAAKVGNAFGVVPDKVVADLERLRGVVDTKMEQTRLAAESKAQQARDQVLNKYGGIPPGAQSTLAPTASIVHSALTPPTVSASELGERTRANFIGRISLIPKQVFDRLSLVKNNLVAALQPAITAARLQGAEIANNIQRGLNSVQLTAPSVNFQGGVVTIQGGGVPGRAVGGPVTGGSQYMVGERGPELFVPNRSGTIIPNEDLENLGSRKQIVNNWYPKELTSADVDMVTHRQNFQLGMQLRGA